MTPATPAPPRPGARIRERLREPVTHHFTVGLAGSVLLAIGALGVGYVPPRSRLGVLTVTDFLRTNTLGSTVAKVCVVVGVLLLLRAWLQLGRDVREGRITGTARLTRMFWVWVVPLVLVPPLFSQDVYSYAAQGNLLNVGYDPYQFGPASIPGGNLEAVSSVWLDTPAPYGPFFLYFGKVVADVFGGHVYIAALVMRLLALLGVWLIAIYLPRLARACGIEPSLAVWAGLLNPLVLMHFVLGAHNDALMLGLVVAGITLAVEGRPIVGTIAIALGGTVKAPALLALGFVGVAWAIQRQGRPDPRRRARIVPWLIVAGVALATFVVANALTGLNFGWIGALDTPGLIHTWLSPTTAMALTVGGAASLVGLGDQNDAVLNAIRLAAEVAVLAVIAWMLLRKRPIAPAAGTGIALLLLAVFGPILQPWYVLWGLVVLSGAALTRRGVPYLVTGTTMLVVYCLLQPSATMDPIVRVPDWLCSAAAIAVGITMLMRIPQTRAEVTAFLAALRRGRWSFAPVDVDTVADVAEVRA